MRKTIGIGVLISLLMSAPLQAFAAYSAANAGAYLESKSQSAWTTMGLIALGKTPNLNHLKSIPGGSAIELAAPILAIAASGNDPRTFSSIDLVANLKNKASGGQIGDTASLNDDIFGLLALIAAGEPLISSLVVSQKQYLLSKQNSNGGWGFQPGGSSDTNMTSAAICALIAAGVEKNNDVINRAVDYLKTSQNTDGGFTYDPTSSFGTSSDSSSTAWVLWALTSAGIQNSAITKNGKSGADFLNTTQTGSGYFTYQAGGAEDAFTPTTTAYAIIALSGKTLPLAVYQKPAGPKTEFRIEGKDEIVCQGFVYAVTALDVVKNAKNQCGFSYTIADTAYGPYLKKVNNDEAAGLIGWLYFVNGVSADVGARDYLIKENDSVIWYYGDYTWLPTRIKLDAETLENSQAITGTVEYFEDSSWKTLSGATILAGAKSATTDGSGKFQVSLPAGFYRVFAEKNGYVRSNQGSVRVGTPSSN
ncbi:MAG TPA: DUF4430 domain-containing protein, partial [Patescibacteria group bacterium]|nr:DUF4430 domain-containing protein [Patescibacteria group bacterium]